MSEFAPIEQGDNKKMISRPSKKIDNIDEIQVGVHGLIMKRGLYKGVLLPQVASERNWSRETFLEHTALKAGMSQDDWKRDAEVYTFSAKIIKE